MALEKMNFRYAAIPGDMLKEIKQGERSVEMAALAALLNSHIELIENYNALVDVVEKLVARQDVTEGADDLLSKIKKVDN